MVNNLLRDFIDTSTDKVIDIINAEHDQIVFLAKEIGDIIINDGLIQLYAIEHDQAFPMELYFRAGGLIQYHRFNVSDLVLRGRYSKEAFLAPDFYDNKQLAHTLYDEYNVDERDAVFIFASTKLNASTVELAKLSKEKGHPVYLLTSKIHLEDDPLKDELYSYCDFILDMNIRHGDDTFRVNDKDVTLNHNLIAAMIAQTLTMEIYRYLVDQGHTPGVLWSLNIEGADEHNGAMMEKYDTRWNS